MLSTPMIRVVGAFLLIMSLTTVQAQLRKPVPNRVVRITDGDTFTLESGLVIRPIGIDAPETRNNRHAPKGYYAQEAKAFLKKLLLNKVVKLEFDVTRTDRNGRILAYVYYDNRVFLNAELVKRGYARVLTIPPNVKYSALFLKLEREARLARRGLWAKP